MTQSDREFNVNSEDRILLFKKQFKIVQNSLKVGSLYACAKTFPNSILAINLLKKY